MASNQHSNSASSVPLVKASELAEYGFCHRSWWLRNVKQFTPDNRANLARGQQAHTRNERQVQLVNRWRQVSFVLFGIGLFILMVMFVVSLA